jgi:D-alanine-D-alanine ligase
LCSNKFLFRDFCQKHGLPTPKFAYANTDREIEHICQTFTFPVVVKPAWGVSSAFVVKVETAAELPEVAEYVRSNSMSNTDVVEIIVSFKESKMILVEEYIDGEEVDINGIIQNGRLKITSISDNDKTEEPFFVETGFSMPSGLPEEEQDALLVQTDKIFEVLDIPNACFQYEAKSTPNGPVPIELNLRMGGDEAYFFTKNVWGMDLIENYVKLVLGIRIDVEPVYEPLTYCAGADFLCENSGVLVELDIDERLYKRPYLDEFIFIKKVGDPVLVPPEGFEYLGWISVTGDNMVEAKANLQEITDLVEYKVVKFHPTSSIGKSSRSSSLSLASIEREQILRSVQAEKIDQAKHKEVSELSVGLLAHPAIHLNSNKLEKRRFEAFEFLRSELKSVVANVQILNAPNIQQMVSSLDKAQVDVIIDMFKEVGGDTSMEANILSVLDFFPIPYVGAQAKCVSLCNDKIMVKKLLTYHDIPTPEFDYAFGPDDKIRLDLEFPLIVKPTDTDNSLGIGNESVVTNHTQLKERVAYITQTLRRPALIEEYIDGYEVEVCVFGNGMDLKVLPLTKINFDALPQEYWHIMSYEAKMGLKPEVYSKISIERPAVFEPSLEKLISELAIDTYNILGCQDYGIVEMRVSTTGNPHVIELTPNPLLDPQGTFVQSAVLAGMTHQELLGHLLKSAIGQYTFK